MSYRNKQQFIDNMPKQDDDELIQKWGELNKLQEKTHNNLKKELDKINILFANVVLQQKTISENLNSFSTGVKELFYKTAKYADKIGEKRQSKEFLEMSK